MAEKLKKEEEKKNFWKRVALLGAFIIGLDVLLD
jgi:hypothetical protein